MLHVHRLMVYLVCLLGQGGWKEGRHEIQCFEGSGSKRKSVFSWFRAWGWETCVKKLRRGAETTYEVHCIKDVSLDPLVWQKF